MILKLRRKFIVIAMVSVTLVMILMAVAINVTNYIATSSDMEDTLDLICGNRGTVPQFDGKKPPGDLGGDRFNAETPYSTRYFVLRYGADGTLDNADMRHIAAVTEDDVDTYLSVALESGVGSGYIGGNYRYKIVEADNGRFMAVFLDCQSEIRSLRTFALASVLVVAVCDILVYILVLLLSRRAIDPVVRNVEKQKRFITDASHELKTPLTVRTTSLRVLEMEVGKRKWIDKIKAQTDKLTELVGDLVTLSRLDEERPRVRTADFDISATVKETAESFRDFAGDNGHELVTDIAEGVTLRGDEYAVRQLVSILLDNAVKYTDPGEPVTLRMRAGKRDVTIETVNACADVDPSSLDRLFDRFYRADASRARQDSGGFGIGLSIARSIAEAHRGSVRAVCPEAGAIKISVTLRGRESGPAAEC